jgi:hypothetical protein
MSQIIEHNVETGEISTREMTKEELAQNQIASKESQNRRSDLEAKESAKDSALAKLAALGLTPEEISAIS